MLSRRSRERGSALVELAITLPMLSLIMIGGAELARIAYAAIEVQNAARAGAAYGSQTSVKAQDSSGIKHAAQNEAPNITDLTFPTVTQYCVCQTTNSSVGSNTTSAQLSCSSSTVNAANYCPTSTTNNVTDTIVEYVYVSTQAQVKTMFNYPGIPSSFTLNGFSEMRVVSTSN